MDKADQDERLSPSRRKYPGRIGVELTLARLLSNLFDDATQSPNLTLARHALGTAADGAAETMMLLYFLEEPCIKPLVLAAMRIPAQERKRILHELADFGRQAANRG
ncbi:hypothetical protein WOC76_15890 [Methylocystis sp. IM3]|uniref:hypothetical protein n=1 Tax=unclassified Methylocystis TaxID=2625913 RepID=UPI0026B8E366